MILSLSLIILSFIGVEVLLIILVKLLRKDFQWLITTDDECPKLEEEGLKSFFAKSFDPTLGWVRRNNSKGIEIGEKGKIYYKIDEIGSRINSNSGKYVNTIACFGDSYTFCRQVDNDETWEYYLENILKSGVLNFGVGNYGLDQAILRYKETYLPNTVNVVIMAVVPETICRIQSQWKHYLEFGNTFAFKPKFILEDGKLLLQENPMRNKSDFSNYKEKLSLIKKNDRFYKEKFRKLQFRLPYIISFFRNFNRNAKLFFSLVMRKIKRSMGNSNSSTEDLPFRFIMESNITLSHKLYNEKKSTDLFYAIINDFVEYALSKNHKPIFILLPQLIDFYLINKIGYNQYSAFFKNINIQNLKVIDFTQHFFKKKNLGDYYVNDKYGGHMSYKGNKYIAKILSDILSKDHGLEKK